MGVRPGRAAPLSRPGRGWLDGWMSASTPEYDHGSAHRPPGTRRGGDEPKLARLRRAGRWAFCPDLAEPLCAQLASVWKLVASIPAPPCDHRQHDDPALA